MTIPDDQPTDTFDDVGPVEPVQDWHKQMQYYISLIQIGNDTMYALIGAEDVRFGQPFPTMHDADNHLGLLQRYLCYQLAVMADPGDEPWPDAAL